MCLSLNKNCLLSCPRWNGAVMSHPWLLRFITLTTNRLFTFLRRPSHIKIPHKVAISVKQCALCVDLHFSPYCLFSLPFNLWFTYLVTHLVHCLLHSLTNLVGFSLIKEEITMFSLVVFMEFWIVSQWKSLCCPSAWHSPVSLPLWPILWTLK